MKTIECSGSHRNRNVCLGNLFESLIIIAIFLMPYDALHVMPSTYRPVSVFPIVLALFVGLMGKKIRLGCSAYPFMAFYIYVVVSTVVRICLGVDGAFQGLKTIVTLSLGIASYIVLYSFFRANRERFGFERTIDDIARVLSAAYVIPLLVGVLETLSLVGILPSSINEILRGVFGGFQDRRLTLTSYEASWASVHLLIAFCANAHIYSKLRARNNLVMAATAFLLMIYTKSLQGAMAFAVGFAVYLVWKAFHFKNIKKLIIQMAVFSVAVFCIFKLLAILSKPGDAYYMRRIANFTSVGNMIRTDGSSFVRIVFPYLALLVWFDHPFFGVGGDAFPPLISTYIDKYFPWAWGTFPHLNPAAELPGSLYTCVPAEFGAIGLILFVGGILLAVKRLIQDGSRWLCSPFISLFVLIILSNQLQQTSYAYFPLWVVLSMINACSSSESGCGHVSSICFNRECIFGVERLFGILKMPDSFSTCAPERPIKSSCVVPTLRAVRHDRMGRGGCESVVSPTETNEGEPS